MNKKIIVSAAIIGIIAVAAIVAFSKINQTPGDENITSGVQDNNVAESSVKEFTMTSFYDDTGVWFSLKEINVNKGDIVRIKITNIKGTHDFVIDEYNIKKMTPLNEEVVIEFTANKAGEFIYYCSVPGHRQKGQWGTLKVLDK